MAAILPFLPHILTALTAAIPFLTKGGRKGMFGEEGGLEEYQPYNAQQEGQIGQYGSDAMQNMPQMNAFLKQFMGNDEESFNQFAAPFLKHFQTKIAPTITERFAGGGEGGLGESGASSGLMNSLSDAGQSLEQGLASERQNQGFKSAALMQNMAQIGLTPMKGFQNISPRQGAIGDYLPAIMKLISSFNTPSAK